MGSGGGDTIPYHTISFRPLAGGKVVLILRASAHKRLFGFMFSCYGMNDAPLLQGCLDKGAEAAVFSQEAFIKLSRKILQIMVAERYNAMSRSCMLSVVAALTFNKQRFISMRNPRRLQLL